MMPPTAFQLTLFIFYCMILCFYRNIAQNCFSVNHSQVYPPIQNNRVDLLWWDCNTTVNWERVDDEIYPPINFYSSKVVFRDVCLFYNGPYISLVIVNFNGSWITSWKASSIRSWLFEWAMPPSNIEIIVYYQKTGPIVWSFGWFFLFPIIFLWIETI